MSSASDLTARARIRDAAIELFADRGIEGATIRDIAQQAGVSSGLLRHHFGSKEGLRDACDEYVLSELMRLGTRFTEFQTIEAITPETLRQQRYITRSVLDGSPAGTAMFDRLIEYGERWLATTDLKIEDPKAFLALLSVMKMSMLTSRDLLSRVLGVDTGEPEGFARVLRASLEIFSTPLVTPEQADLARGALERLHSTEEQP
ncbi:TetR/AcrR family transcriptional regulator [Actinoplanes sp. KI2]|uniref:TetR/AcrR family transcriptional regulator n=1 Tax=Actinoplanes sp. KI2 TaxID=2983315 RepID=UPI0021D5EBE4|nr:helix-turn-helix domain-containing protein [Actinoplanes sp. KI2]MCU7723089.1 TetR/AcrR family transcriptional regulator [Actinoplanes sp. KI2]